MWLAIATAGAVETREVPLPGEFLPAAVWDVVQDDAGWIWIAGVGGLVRYDGAHTVAWGGDALRREVQDIVRVDGDVVTVRLRDSSVWTARPHTAEPVPGPDGAPLVGVKDVAWDGTGLWVLDAAGLRRVADDRWTTPGQPVPGARELWAGVDRVWVADATLLRERRVDGTDAVTLALPRVTDVAMSDGAPLAAVGAGGEVWWLEGGVREVARVTPTPTGIVARGDDAWVATGESLVRVEAGHVVARLPVADGIPNTGPILLDHEGGLWTGTFLGMKLRPSPDTLVWTRADGLPGTGITWLLAGEDPATLAWVATWPGAGRLAADGTGGDVPFAWFQWPACRDVDGHGWGIGARSHDRSFPVEAWRFDHTPPTSFGVLPGHDPAACAPAASGGLWLGGGDGVARLDRDGTFRRVASPGEMVWGLLETSEGRVWAFERRRACVADGAALVAGAGAWTCSPLPVGMLVRDAVQVDGELWAAGEGTGVLRLTDTGWTRMEQSRDLPTDIVFSLTPAREGGVWLATMGAVWRLRPAGQGRWDVVERLDTWQGLPASAGASVDELADGTVWVGTEEGLARVPPDSRGGPSPPPAPFLADLRVDGHVATPAGPVTAAWGHNQVEITATTPSYRDRSRLRWRFRVGPDEPWSAPSPESTARFVDLAAGNWAIEAQASLDGVAWSASSAPLSLAVPLPWWLRPPALVAAAVVLVGLIAGVHHLRVAAAVRVERERTRIAMDLHDELGSGLGTLAVLSGLVAEGDLGEAERRDVATRAVQTAQSLGDAVSDIVWSLRRDAGSPATLGALLADRGHRLFADGSGSRFEVALPDRWPAARLAPRVYRNVHLIAAEALMNAARHARAAHVWLRLEPGHPWRLVVEDDGAGLAVPSEGFNSGSGLPAMRSRAEQIGARLSVGERPGGGTRVELTFGAGGAWRWTS